MTDRPQIMTRDNPTSDSIASPQDFETVLADAIEKATAGGIDVRGAWEFQTQNSTHNWEVEIIELAKDLDGNE